MVMNTALRRILSQVGKGKATYVIRRSFIEITTVKRYLEDKVSRIYPVGDLVMPINGGVQGGGMQVGLQGGVAGQVQGGVVGGAPSRVAGGGRNRLGRRRPCRGCRCTHIALHVGDDRAL